MQIIDLRNNRIADLPCGCAIAFGFFDGVHVGHRQLITAARSIAGDRPVATWTFDGMPKLPRGAHLTTKSEKCAALADCGADYVIFEDFDSVRSMSGREFFEKRIAQLLFPSAVVCGYNFRFGERASCTAAELEKFAKSHGIGCAVVPEVTLGGSPVSSSAIRELVRAGDMLSAARILGRPYSLTGEVSHGRRIGTKIGHPTANLHFPEDKLIPPRGVYSCTVRSAEDGWLKYGVCNIGSRPTVNDDTCDVTLEVYVFDHEGELYGREITVSLVELLRTEKRFNSLDELRAQITLDADNAKTSLKKEGYTL